MPLCSRPSTELVTTQCHSCLKHLPEGLKFCPCGACLRPDEDTINRIQRRFKASIVPYYFARINRSRRKKCGEQKWQTDHWKAKDAMRGAVKHNENKNPLISVRWMTDEQNRSSQMAQGWTEAYCRHLDYLVTVDITHVAPHHQRHRYESTITMKCTDSDLQLGPMKDGDDYQATARLLVNIRKEQGRANTHIPKMQRTRQRNTLHPKVQQRLDWLSEHYEEYFSKQSSSSSSSSSWTQNRWQDAQWQDTQWEDLPWHEQQWEEQKW